VQELHITEETAQALLQENKTVKKSVKAYREARGE